MLSRLIMFLDWHPNRNPVPESNVLLGYSLFAIGIACVCVSVGRFIKCAKVDKKNSKERNKVFGQAIIFLIIGTSLIIASGVLLSDVIYSGVK